MRQKMHLIYHKLSCPYIVRQAHEILISSCSALTPKAFITSSVRSI
jgi:hypothetical protein